MAHDSFDFVFVQRTWTWSHRVGDGVIDRSSRDFATLNDCIADACKAGFRAGEAVRTTQPADAGSAAVAGGR